MTSFGAINIVSNIDFTPTFKVQGQVYHQIGSLLPTPDQDSKFLQIYFTGDEEEEIDQRCAVINGTRREIISNLQRLFHQHNYLVKLFHVALDQMPSDNYKVIIRANKTPVSMNDALTLQRSTKWQSWLERNSIGETS